MDTNWVSSLDMLAASGVIDFDAPAFLLDQKPRYIGHPDLENLPLENPMYLPEGTKLRDIPDKDLYEKSSDGNLIHNPTWKKILFGAIAIPSIIAAVLLCKKIPKKLPKITMPKFTGLKNFTTKSWNVIKRQFLKLKNRIKP